MPSAAVNGIQLGYEIAGRGDWVVLIGGYTMTKEAWGSQAGALAREFRVLTFDNRGVGESTVPGDPFTIADMAADTVALMDFLDIKAAHIFGVSMGGLIGQVLALDYPGRVKKLVLGCTTHGGRHAVQPEKEVMEILAKAADPGVPREEAYMMRAQVVFAPAFLEKEKDRLQMLMRQSLAHWPTPRGAAGQMAALSRFNVRHRLGEIRCPTLVITGAQDRMMPPENSRLLAEAIPGARLEILEGAGHSFFLEKPEEVNRILRDFFLAS